MVAGLVLIGAGWALSLSTLGIALFALGAIALATGIVGWCPAYSLFRISTRKVPTEPCANCETDVHRF
jgi:hypothetical protein